MSAPAEALPGKRRWMVEPYGPIRMLLAVLIALALAPGTWLRSPTGHVQQLSADPVAFRPPHNWPEGLTLEGLWELDSPDAFFGGYSALLVGPGGRARAFSDLGEELEFTLPGYGPLRPRLSSLPVHPWFGRARQDVESATQDPRTGRYWLGYEQVHVIRRFGPGVEPNSFVRRGEMRGWAGNSGVEAMVRLADGRFLVLGERNHKGLLFAGDPVERGPAIRFTVAYPGNYHPVDVGQLPDGRVLLLMRKVVPGWPAFGSMLLVGDVESIGEETRWEPQLFAWIDGRIPRENYEALAVDRHADGRSATIWLMSDDNFSIGQRTLLAKLRWSGEAGEPTPDPNPVRPPGAPS